MLDHCLHYFSLCVHVSVCTCYLVSWESRWGGVRDGDWEREGVKCKHKATTACSPAKGVGTMLLFQGRVVSDCDSSSSSVSVFSPLFLSLVTPSLSLLPPISPPQREKRWSISSAGGERNSSSVSRGVSGRESEGWDGALGRGGEWRLTEKAKGKGYTRGSCTIALAYSPRDKVGLNCSITHTPALQNVPPPAFSMQIGYQIMPFVFILPTVRLWRRVNDNQADIAP